MKSILNTHPMLISPPDHLASELNDCDDYALQFKAAFAATYRQRALMTQSPLKPPAVGMVITQSHVVNIVLTKGSDNKPKAFLIDPMVHSPKLIDDPDQCTSCLKSTVNFIYF